MIDNDLIIAEERGRPTILTSNWRGRWWVRRFTAAVLLGFVLLEQWEGTRDVQSLTGARKYVSLPTYWSMLWRLVRSRTHELPTARLVTK